MSRELSQHTCIGNTQVGGRTRRCIGAQTRRCEGEDPQRRGPQGELGEGLKREGKVKKVGEAYIELFHAMDAVADEGKVFGAPIYIYIYVCMYVSAL